MGEMIIKYDVTEAAIEELRSKYSIVPVIEDNKTLKEVKSRITVVRTLRTSVERKRKELKKDALEYGKKVDIEAGRIKFELFSIEEPMKVAQAEYEAKVKAEKALAASIEAERRQVIQAKIDSISNLVAKNAGSSSFELASVMDQLSEPDDYNYGEFLARKNKVLTQTMESLQSMMNSAEQREAEAAAVAERERLFVIQQEAMAKERRELDEQRKAERAEALEVERAAKVERDALIAIERGKLAEERRALAEQRAAEEKLNAEREVAAAQEHDRLAAIEWKIKEEKEKLEQERQAVIAKENARIAAEKAAIEKAEAEEIARLEAEKAAAKKKLQEDTDRKLSKKKEADAFAASMVTCPHCNQEFSLREVGR